MTGYGRSQALIDGSRIEIELRSVNHKFCEVSIRLPRLLASHETRIKKKLQQRFLRGRLDLQVILNGAGELDRRLELDLPLARQYHRLLQDLKAMLRLKGEIDLSLFSNFKNIITVKEQPSISRRLIKTLDDLLDQAAKGLENMRVREGRILSRDLTRRLVRVRKAIALVKTRIPNLNLEHKRKLQSRINRLTQGVVIDPSRVEQEAALFAIRSDVSEEVTRMESHIGQFAKMLHSTDPIGRSLDFLIQEMHREVNTLGSKGNDVYVSKQVIFMKSEIEKLREQVQNIE